MAVTKSLKTAVLSIEVQSGTDKTGDPTYTKKSFSNVKIDADSQNVYDVAEAIKSVINADTRASYLVETSDLKNA